MTPASTPSGSAGPKTPPSAAPSSLLASLDARSSTLRVTRGISWWVLEQALRSEGLTLGWGPPLGPAPCLLTGLEQGLEGLGSACYGSPIQNVAGIDAVLGTGGAASTLTVPRSAAGPDFKHLLLGAQGRFGRLEQVVLRVYPMPTCQVRIRWEARSLGEGLQTLAKSIGLGSQPLIGCVAPLREGPAASARCAVLLAGEARVVAARRAALERLLASSGGARQVVAEELDPAGAPVGTAAGTSAGTAAGAEVGTSAGAGEGPSGAAACVLSVLGESGSVRNRLEALRGVETPSWQVSGSWRQLLDAWQTATLPSLRLVLALGHERALGVLGSDAEGAKWRTHLRSNLSSEGPTAYPVGSAMTLDQLLTLCEIGG